MATQFGFPEIIAYHIIPAAKKVTIILFLSAPAAILMILFIAYKITHKVIGPFDRIIQELDKRIKGEKKGYISLRKNDRFQPLVDRINKLLDKIK